MASELNIDHSVQELKNSCNEEFNQVNFDLREIERKLLSLESVSKMNKLIHHGQIKKRREYLESEIEKLKKKAAELHQEMEMYNKYGKDIPKDAPNYEALIKMLDNRIYKLEICIMIELGMM